jgi:sialate O-acetylesterase
MIEQWRTDFHNPDMPFLFVQLSNYDVPTSIGKPIWAELREAQLMTWQKVKRTGMAVSIDVGDKTNIHPTQKEPVGKRLAASALNNVYGMKIPYSGPLYKSMKVESNLAILTFDFVYDGFMNDEELKSFTICGADHQFVSAKAVIKNNQLVISSDSVAKPVAVRYGWSNWTDANLKNKAGFPATPFRTDDFPMITANQK